MAKKRILTNVTLRGFEPLPDEVRNGPVGKKFSAYLAEERRKRRPRRRKKR